VLQAFAFERVGVVVADIYFVDPDPPPGQEGPERGVRVEVRLMERPDHDGSIYASRPILVGRPVWRADLLESVEGRPGSYDRTHHHPGMTGWEPGDRRYERALSADPLAWLAGRLRDLPGLVDQAGLPPGTVDDEDVRELRASTDEIVATVERLLARVRAGELGGAPAGDGDGPTTSARVGWL
jgi:hypothetical protein